MVKKLDFYCIFVLYCAVLYAFNPFLGGGFCINKDIVWNSNVICDNNTWTTSTSFLNKQIRLSQINYLYNVQYDLYVSKCTVWKSMKECDTVIYVIYIRVQLPVADLWLHVVQHHMEFFPVKYFKKSVNIKCTSKYVSANQLNHDILCKFLFLAIQHKFNIFSFSSKDTSDILFSAFKNAFVMKRFICFTDIFIYNQFSCHGYLHRKSFRHKYW